MGSSCQKKKISLIACQAGHYGENCLQRCSDNCKVTNRCNRFRGECDGGCKPGWKLPTCQQGNWTHILVGCIA
jgi:hypothetical protein